uniref:MiT/TFE transcription factors N-terminal domain-containing protein n=1 Tax=Bombyx mori TaxID=7091 RepID=A0A8R2RAF2_BOMMO|nr:microphthalmia-associated transcription factor [Bombyx mori]
MTVDPVEHVNETRSSLLLLKLSLQELLKSELIVGQWSHFESKKNVLPLDAYPNVLKLSPKVMIDVEIDIKIEYKVVVFVCSSPPTFKTLTPTSRTQLKQQLMREHAQEQLRRESQNQQAGQSKDNEEHKKKSSPTEVPRITPHVELPPQVLQVRTVLENPTRYHVIQKQKSQVRQYLSESFQPHTQVATTRGPPTQSAPELGAKPPASPDRPSSSLLSPGMCSVGTNNSEADEFLEDILSLDSGAGPLSSSGPPRPPVPWQGTARCSPMRTCTRSLKTDRKKTITT